MPGERVGVREGGREGGRDYESDSSFLPSGDGGDVNGEAGGDQSSLSTPPAC